MIRNLCTCGAYAIRSYPDGRKDLFLRSIWDYAKRYNLIFDLKNGYAESLIHLFESKKGYGRWHNLFFDPKNGYEKWQERILGKCFRGMFLRHLF